MHGTTFSSYEPSAAVVALLQVLNSASNGVDITSDATELIQTYLNKPAANPHVRKLAYEVCKHANLTDSDYRRLWQYVQSDTNSNDVEVVVTALRFIPCLPASDLAGRLVVGQLSELLKPCLSADAAAVRAAAVQALSSILLLTEVQRAAASSQGLANSYEGLWDELTDSLLDERPFVVGLAAAATAKLLECGVAGGASAFSGGRGDPDSAVASDDSASLTGFMASRVADRAAQRLSVVLGPVLDTCGLVPAPGQVAVCDMLVALARRVLLHTMRAAAGCATPAPPPGVPVPGLASLVASIAAYLSTLVRAGDPVARTEACGAVLALAADLAAAGPAALGAAAGLPQGLIMEAAYALTELQELEFMEAGLADMCEAVAGALPALLPTARAQVLRKLWPMVGRVANLPRRARIYSMAWKAAVAAEMDCRTSSAPSAGAGAALPPPVFGTAPMLTDTLGALAGLGIKAPGPGEAAGIVTSVPTSCRVTAQLEEHYVELLMAGKAPNAEANGAFAAAQATMSLAAPPPSTSILSTVTSMARSAPPPPPPLSVPKSESARSASTGPPSLEAGKVTGKPEKKGGVFGGLFGRSKTKVRGGEADADHSGVAKEEEAAAAAAAAAAVAAKDDAAAAAAAAAAAQRPPPAAPQSPASASGGSMVLPSDVRSISSMTSPPAAEAARPSPHATLRHELLQCLLQQIAHHPAATVAAELCAEQAAAARHDRHPPTHTAAATHGSGDATLAAGDAVAGSPAPPRRVCVVTQWIALASEVLSSSSACVGWEPFVMPTITTTPSVAATGRAPVNFNSLTADLWLSVLQAAMQAARAVQAMLGRLVAEAVDAAAAAEAEGQGQMPYAGLGYGVPYGMAPGALQAQAAKQAEVTPEAYYRALLSYLKEKADVLQGLAVRLLSNWASLSAATRPRLVWVAAHCLALPGHWDDQWEVLLGCLDLLLLRGTDVLAAVRRHDIMGSALAGNLLKAGRQAWADPTKPFLFDIASASALCESPEYEVMGLLVALAALQHLAARLVNAIAEAVPHGAAGAAHGQAAAVAKRLDTMLRNFIGTEVAAAPHVRDWVKRILRSLTTIATYVPPVNLPVTVAALGFIAKQVHQADGTDVQAAADGDDDSSDASSAYHPEELQQELPPALAAAVAAATAAAANKGGAVDPSQDPHHHLQGLGADGVGTVDANGDAAGGQDGAAAAGEAGKGPASSTYLVHSAAAAVPMWGYPFAPLSCAALHTSKRARRQRALLDHLSAAAAATDAPRPVAAAALRALQSPGTAAPGGTGGASHAAGPALSFRTQYRLDSEAFWAALPSTHSPWQELTGPADPLLLRGCYMRPDPARGDPATLVVMLSAVNRLPVDIADVELSLKSNGPLLSNLRRVVTWELPRLAAHDRVAASFSFKVLGYGDMQLHARLRLCPAPARVEATPLQLNCLPLEVPCTLLLRPPRTEPDAAEFFRAWGTLPARTELPGVCTWPGPDGGALLLSSLLRQPLGCAWLQHVPAVCGFQAAFTAHTAMGDPLALLVVTQLMPPAAPGAPLESFCTFSIRSSSPDLILGLQSSAAAWLQQITAGAACIGSSGGQAQPLPAYKPPLHPRVAALLQSYTASAAQLASVAVAGLAATADGAAARGAGDLGVAQLKNAALLEWQRVSSLAV